MIYTFPLSFRPVMLCPLDFFTWIFQGQQVKIKHVVFLRDHCMICHMISVWHINCSIVLSNCHPNGLGNKYLHLGLNWWSKIVSKWMKQWRLSIQRKCSLNADMETINAWIVAGSVIRLLINSKLCSSGRLCNPEQNGAFPSLARFLWGKNLKET